MSVPQNKKKTQGKQENKDHVKLVGETVVQMLLKKYRFQSFQENIAGGARIQ